jgi:hypothetical protein
VVGVGASIRIQEMQWIGSTYPHEPVARATTVNIVTFDCSHGEVVLVLGIVTLKGFETATLYLRILPAMKLHEAFRLESMPAPAPGLTIDGALPAPGVEPPGDMPISEQTGGVPTERFEDEGASEGAQEDEHLVLHSNAGSSRCGSVECLTVNFVMTEWKKTRCIGGIGESRQNKLQVDKINASTNEDGAVNFTASGCFVKALLSIFDSALACDMSKRSRSHGDTSYGPEPKKQRSLPYRIAVVVQDFLDMLVPATPESLTKFNK